MHAPCSMHVPTPPHGAFEEDVKPSWTGCSQAPRPQSDFSHVSTSMQQFKNETLIVYTHSVGNADFCLAYPLHCLRNLNAIASVALPAQPDKIHWVESLTDSHGQQSSSRVAEWQQSQTPAEWQLHLQSRKGQEPCTAASSPLPFATSVRGRPGRSRGRHLRGAQQTQTQVRAKLGKLRRPGRHGGSRARLCESAMSFVVISAHAPAPCGARSSNGPFPSSVTIRLHLRHFQKKLLAHVRSGTTSSFQAPTPNKPQPKRRSDGCFSLQQ